MEQSPGSMQATMNPRWPLLLPFTQRNYLLLWIGSVISFVGANLTFIAFPWLVLQISGDPLAIGSVLALAGVPRAVFMLVGGAATDRFSPRTVMLFSTFFRMLLMLTMAMLVWFDTITMWQIFILAFLFGTLDAFFWPASSAILPRLLDPTLLPAGNALLQGSSQASLMLGPVLAGLIIATRGGSELEGIAFVFFLDVAGFFISLITLYLIRQPSIESESDQGSFSIQTIAASLKEGLQAMWEDTPVRLMTIVMAIFTLFFRGPHLVGIPVLADARFEQGALAFGMIMSAFGVGALMGIIAAGSLPPVRDRWIGRLLLLDLLVLGSSFIVYAVAPSVEYAMAASAAGGLIDGYVVVIIISWLQKRIHESQIGRVMSVVMFSNNGLAPVSAAAAGLFLTYSIEWTFLGAGFILVALCLIGFLMPLTRYIGLGNDEPDSSPSSA